MASAELLGLVGVEIDLVEREADGSWSVHARTAPGRRVCCPGCGQAAERVRERVTHSVAHVVVAPMRVWWHKARWWCDNSGCDKASFAEAGPVAGPKAGVSGHATVVMGHLVGDWLVPVSRVAAGVGVSWHTAHQAAVEVATQAGIQITDTTTNPETAATTEAPTETGQADGEQAEAETIPDGPGQDTGTDTTGVDREERGSGLPERRCRWAGGVLPPVRVLGIDDHRRGKPLYHRDPVTGVWVADADRWQTVFVDSAGGHGLLGQAEGRVGLDVTAWLAAQDPAWRAGIEYVTIDMSTVYKSAVTRDPGLLPNATLVADAFHVVQLANKTISDVRRRVTFEHYGRRGRATDPEYAIKNLLVRGKEKLSHTARHTLLCTLADLGDSGRQLGAAWRAKEHLRAVIALSPNQTGVATTGHQIRRAFDAFFTFCATTGATIPEIQTLAQTVSTWRTEIAHGVLTGHSNATAEGINRLVKLVYRSAFGFRNVTNQQRRSRYTASRSTRPEWLHTVTTTRPPPVAT